jgi:methionine aminopeptidase
MASSEQKYLEAIKKAAAEGRTVDIGKAIAQVERKQLDYSGTYCGRHKVRVFIGEHQGAIRIGKAEVAVSIKEAERIQRILQTG